MTMDAQEVTAIVDVLARAGVAHVISGGWGIDALVGRQTRAHDDLDIGIDALRVDDVVALLARRGYAAALDQRPARLELHGPNEHKVDLHPIRWDDVGSGRQEGLGGQVFDYPAGEIVEGQIGGLPVRCISAALQRGFRMGDRLRPRDEADLAVLDLLDKAGP